MKLSRLPLSQLTCPRVQVAHPCVTLRQFIRCNSSRLPPRHEQDEVPEEDLVQDQGKSYPNLMTPEPLYDSAFTETFHGRRSGRKARIILRNDPPLPPTEDDSERMYIPEKVSDNNPKRFLSIPENRRSNLHTYPLLVRRITQQTGKGKIHRMYVLMVVGDGNGLVGYGEGKHDDIGYARDRAYTEAVRNMDYVERFEGRTIWTDMHTKLGATQVFMRPRPVGFGLRCNPNIHQVLKAAGVKDVSAKVWGSRNPLNVIKATFRMIQSGHAPQAMGDGIGGKGRKLDQGSGMRTKEVLERERGRKLVDGRTW